MRPSCEPLLAPASLLLIGSGWLLLRSRLDGGDLDLGLVLAVTLALAVAGLVLELHDGDLGALVGADQLGGHADLGRRLGVAGHGLAVNEEKRDQLGGVARLAL